MRGLTIILIDNSPARFREALGLASAQGVLGARARLFLQGPAVALVQPPIICAEDDRHAKAGLPALAHLLDQTLDLGVEIVVCQTGLQMAGLDAAALDARIGCAGPLAVLQTLADDRLVVI